MSILAFFNTLSLRIKYACQFYLHFGKFIKKLIHKLPQLGFLIMELIALPYLHIPHAQTTAALSEGLGTKKLMVEI